MHKKTHNAMKSHAMYNIIVYTICLLYTINKICTICAIRTINTVSKIRKISKVQYS